MYYLCRRTDLTTFRIIYLLINYKYMTTKKREYEKPSMEVFKLQQQQHLLAGSNGDGNLTPMDDPEDL